MFRLIYYISIHSKILILYYLCLLLIVSGERQWRNECTYNGYLTFHLIKVYLFKTIQKIINEWSDFEHFQVLLAFPIQYNFYFFKKIFNNFTIIIN